jgi:hypothetical protein
MGFGFRRRKRIGMDQLQGGIGVTPLHNLQHKLAVWAERRLWRPTAPRISIGVFANELVAPELEQVAALRLDLLALRARTGQEPFGAAMIAGEPVAVVAVVNVGDTSEATRKSLAHSARGGVKPIPLFPAY